MPLRCVTTPRAAVSRLRGSGGWKIESDCQMAEAEAVPYVAPVLEVNSKKRKVEDAASAAKLPRYGEFKDDLHVEASEITEKLLDDWVIEAPRVGQDNMIFTGIGKFKDKYRIVFTSGGILSSDGFKPGKFGGTVEITLSDGKERAGMEIFNAWVRKRFLKRESFAASQKPSPEQMAENHNALMEKNGTIKMRIDLKDPPVFALYDFKGSMSATEKTQLGNKPWNRVVLEVKSFYTDGLKSGVSSRLMFLRADPYAAAEEVAPKRSVEYDT